MKPSYERFQCTAFLIITLASVSLCSPSAFADDKKCTSNADCTKFGFSHCDTTAKNCVCDVGCVEDSTKKCVHAKLGDSCSGPEGCQYVANGVCSKSKVCACEDGYIGNKEGDACTVGKLNDTCTSDTDCKNVANSTCAKIKCDSKDGCKVCSCKEGFRADGETECLQLIEIGKECDLSDPMSCGLFATCTNSTCICEKGYKKKDGFKYDCKGGIHEFCLSSSDCYDKYAVCNVISNTVPMPACECPKEHPFDGEHCSAGTTAFSTFSIVGALMALVTMNLIS